MNRYIPIFVSVLVMFGCSSTPEKSETETISRINKDIAIRPTALGVGVYYVCNDGSDSNSGLSPDQPFLTYDHALLQATGDHYSEDYILFCRGGTFVSAIAKLNSNQCQSVDGGVTTCNFETYSSSNEEMIPNVSGETYFIDCEAGNDANDGLSKEQAWASIGKVLTKTEVGYWDTVSPNKWTIPQYHEPWTAAPNDSAFLFKRGCSFEGYLNMHAWTPAGFTENYTFSSYGDLNKPWPVINAKALSKKFRSSIWTNAHAIHLKNMQIIQDPKQGGITLDLRGADNSSIENVSVSTPEKSFFYNGAENLLINNLVFSDSEISEVNVQTDVDSKLVNQSNISAINADEYDATVGMYDMATESPVIVDASTGSAVEQIPGSISLDFSTTYFNKRYGAKPDMGQTDEPVEGVVEYSGNVYYVDCESGNDANDGLSQQSAWLSLDKLKTKIEVSYQDTVAPNEWTSPPYHEPWIAAPNGSAFLLKRGCSFDGYLSVHSWTPNGFTDNYTFGAYGDPGKPLPIIRGVPPKVAARSTVWTNGHTIHLKNLHIINDPSLDNGGVTLSASADSSVENVIVQNAARDGILADQTTNLLIKNSVVGNNQLSGGRGGGLAASGINLRVIGSSFINNGRDKIGAHNIYIRHLDNAVIEDNLLVGGSNLGVVLHGSSNDVAIKNNYITGNSNGIDISGGYPGEPEVFNRIFISGNIIKDNGYREGEQGYGLLLRSMTNSKVINNLVVGNRLGALILYDKNTGDSTSNQVIIAHNDFVEPSSSYGVYFGGPELLGVSVINNIFDHDGENKAALNISLGVSFSALDINNNIYFMPNGGEQKVFNFGGSFYSLDQVVQQYGYESTGFYADPEFVDRTKYDFHILDTSPAIASSTKTSVNIDLEGSVRDDFSAIGAYEAK